MSSRADHDRPSMVYREMLPARNRSIPMPHTPTALIAAAGYGPIRAIWIGMHLTSARRRTRLRRSTRFATRSNRGCWQGNRSGHSRNRPKAAIGWSRSARRSDGNAVLQSRQLAAHTGTARGGEAVVDEHAAREVGEDRRQGRPARTLDHFPDGRGHGAACSVPPNPDRHGGAPAVASGTTLTISTGRGYLAVSRGHASQCRLTGPDSPPHSGRRPVGKAPAVFPAILPLRNARFDGCAGDDPPESYCGRTSVSALSAQCRAASGRRVLSMHHKTAGVFRAFSAGRRVPANRS